jgi:hypothetical protein
MKALNNRVAGMPHSFALLTDFLSLRRRIASSLALAVRTLYRRAARSISGVQRGRDAGTLAYWNMTFTPVRWRGRRVFSGWAGHAALRASNAGLPCSGRTACSAAWRRCALLHFLFAARAPKKRTYRNRAALALAVLVGRNGA